MDIPTIRHQLETNHQQFLNRIGALTREEYLQAPTGKWNAGQHLDHIYRAVQPVNLALSLPDFLLRILFGKANRPSKTYEGLVEKYQAKLAAGGRASGRFIPPQAVWEKRSKLTQNLEKQVNSLVLKTKRYSEEQLDLLLLPHPILGKLTLREMLYFTAYHVTHHQKALERNLPFATTQS